MSLENPSAKQLQIEHAAGKSYKAKLVKLADKIANLRDMVDMPPSEWASRAGASLRLGQRGHRRIPRHGCAPRSGLRRRVRKKAVASTSTPLPTERDG